MSKVAPAIQRFKFHHFGHDMVILHETDIRKDRGDFRFLKTRERKEAFLGELSVILEDAPFTLISTVIDKPLLKQRYGFPRNPCHIALAYGLERVHFFLDGKEQGQRLTHVVVENRGKREDDELEL